MSLHSKDYIKIGKKVTSEVMRNSYVIKPYVKPEHYKTAKTVVSALNFIFRFLESK